MGVHGAWFVAICTLSASSLAESLFDVLLYGEKIKGMVNVRQVDDEHYELNFEFAQRPPSISASVHAIGVEYTSTSRNQHCDQALHSPRIAHIERLSGAKIKIKQLIAHTIVISDDQEAYVCATVLPGDATLLKASFDSTTIAGDLYVIPIEDQIRLLPSLRSIITPQDLQDSPSNISWAFVESCDVQGVPQSSSDVELLIDDHRTISINTVGSNISLSAFELFVDSKPAACAPLKRVKSRLMRSGNTVFEQVHVFDPLKSSPPLQQVRIASSCSANDTTLQGFKGYFPMLTTFGTETIMLKKVINGNECLTIIPEFETHSAIAYFTHPVMGNVILVDVDGVIFLVSNLRTHFDDSTVLATVQISPTWVDPAGCPQYFRACDGCQVAEHVAEVKGRNTTQEGWSSSMLDAFPLQMMRSLSIDLGWAKACANLTQLHHGIIEATATIRRYSPVSARPIGTFRLLENALSGKTEIIVDHSMKQVTSIELHQRGVDMSVTSGPPCGELTIGSKEHYQWLETLQKVLNSTHRESRITIDGRLITEAESLLGKTVFISEGTDVACGTIEVAGEKKIAGAKFDGKFRGRIKVVQTLTGPQGLPTEVFYYFEQGNETITHQREDQRLEWSVVSLMNSSCENSLIFNPFQYDDSQCGSHAESCAIGDLSKRSSLLELNIRRQITIKDLSLSGPLSVTHRWIRVRPENDLTRSECAPLEEWYEETFRWTALSSRTLAQLQKELAERFGVEPFQVAVHYNRELIGSRCSIYRITLTASKDVITNGLSLFNREERRFYSDEELRCSNDTAAGHLASSASRGFDVFAIAYRLLIIASAALFLRNV